ncbi:MAG: transposase family protein [Methylococcales bacterium]|nr:transposase family protein [Methylococcales bacterium]
MPYKHGIPSDDTLRRFFRAIDTEQFQRLFIEWVQAWLNPEVTGKVLAIDGKTLRGSHDGDRSPIHLGSAMGESKWQCRPSTDIEWLRGRPPEWKNLNSISAIDSECHVGATVTQETRYFIRTVG